MKTVYNVYKNKDEKIPFAGFDTLKEAEKCADYYTNVWDYDCDIRKENE